MKSFITYLEEHLTRKEYQARKKAAKAQMVTDASENMGITTPRMEPAGITTTQSGEKIVGRKKRTNFATMFHNIEQLHNNSKAENDRLKSLPIKIGAGGQISLDKKSGSLPVEDYDPPPMIGFDELSKEQQALHHYEVSAAIDTINRHRDILTGDMTGGHNQSDAFETMVDHYRSLLDLNRPTGYEDSEHQGKIDRHKLMHIRGQLQDKTERAKELNRDTRDVRKSLKLGFPDMED